MRRSPLEASPYGPRVGTATGNIDAAEGDAAPEFDKDGNGRFDDSATTNTGVGTPDYADMGAYEYQGP